MPMKSAIKYERSDKEAAAAFYMKISLIDAYAAYSTSMAEMIWRDAQNFRLKR